MKVCVLFLCLLSLSVSVLAQEVHLDFGAKAGVPLTLGVVAPTQPNFPGRTITTTPFGPRMLFGPTATLSVDRLAVDVDVIFRPVRFESRSEETCCTLIDTIRATSLEVPVFVSYRFGNSSLRPYAGAGIVPFETQWGRIDTHNTFHDRGDLQTHVVFSYPGIASTLSPPAFVFGGGAAFPMGKLLLRSELRYTRWSGQLLRQDQWDVLLSVGLPAFRFGRKGSGRNTSAEHHHSDVNRVQGPLK